MTTTLQHETHQVSRKQKYTYTISCPPTTVVKQGLLRLELLYNSGSDFFRNFNTRKPSDQKMNIKRNQRVPTNTMSEG